jgi:hypothetical protein
MCVPVTPGVPPSCPGEADVFNFGNHVPIYKCAGKGCTDIGEFRCKEYKKCVKTGGVVQDWLCIHDSGCSVFKKGAFCQNCVKSFAITLVYTMHQRCQ